MKRLRDALKEVAQRVEREGRFEGKNQELHNANISAAKLFASVDPIYRSLTAGERPVNIRLFALLRANRYCRRNDIDWRAFDWDSLLQWFYDNWETILRILMSLLVFV